mgnify:CR=1 FL=1
MVTGESMMDVPFEWGSTVRVLSDPGNRLASVCGFRQVETALTAAEFGVAVGTYLVLVEFDDGSSSEIPSSQLQHIPG